MTNGREKEINPKSETRQSEYTPRKKAQQQSGRKENSKSNRVRKTTVPQEVAVMDAESLTKVMMPNRNGFIADDRPDTSARRCMTNC